MKTSRLPYLFIFPAFVFFVVISHKFSLGPDFIKSRYDPSYIFLMNSLNIANLSPSDFTIQPGLTLQTIGALSIKFFRLFDYPADMTESVIYNPETYLRALEIEFALILAMSAFLAGYALFRYSGDIYAAMMIQLSPIISINISYVAATYSPDSLLMSATLLLLAYSIRYIGTTHSKHCTFIFSLICGFGLATKFVFLPSLIIPLILLKGFGRRFTLLILTFVSFLFFTIPGILSLGKTLGWLSAFLTRSGRYGTGESNIVDPGTYMNNLWKLITNESLFLWLSVAVLFLLFIRFIFKSPQKNQSGEAQFLKAMILVIILQIFISAKQYTPRYIIPAFMMILPAFYFSFRLLPGWLRWTHSLGTVNPICFLISLFIILSFTINAKKFNDYSQKQYLNSLVFSTMITDYTRDESLIVCYGSSSEPYALAFGISSAGKLRNHYTSFFLDRFKSDLAFFEIYSGKIWSFRTDFKADEFIRRKGRLYLQIRKDFNNLNTLETVERKLKEDFGVRNLQMKEVAKNQSDEYLYEILIL
ncbi:MAG: hypothetical protein K1X85_09155 [Ignavibacteria bacterium]|nr:hypothetical protein [Ignavibacteria bacterium]